MVFVKETYLALPHLVETHASKQLLVNGKPFLMRAAEVQNSSFSSAEYMRTKWADLAAMNVNTVLGAVTWEMVEPHEQCCQWVGRVVGPLPAGSIAIGGSSMGGSTRFNPPVDNTAHKGCYDYSELDAIIHDAKENGLKLVLLWFGSYKNGLSTYMPPWVKRDPGRFPRARIRKGGAEDVADALSPFHEAPVAADAKAFAALMKHLREIDGIHSTVIMVQVENEPGLIGDSRDFSTAAREVFSRPVPSDLLEFLREGHRHFHTHLAQFLDQTWDRSGWQDNQSWESVFGSSSRTDELFMAYHYARYVDQVARAGASEYPIPLYTNVWLNYGDDDEGREWPIVAGGGHVPGGYPSGGAVTNVLDIWLHFAPALAFIAPDIYLNNYSTTCASYARMNHPLFIPEQRRDEYGARRIWEALGSHYAIGAAPFGIDTVDPEACAFTRHYALISSLSDIILEAHRQPPGSSYGFYFDEVRQCDTMETSKKLVTMGDFCLQIERASVFGRAGPGCGMIIQLRSDATEASYLMIGWGFQVSFTSAHDISEFTGIPKFEEKYVHEKSGQLQTLRTFGGDETRSGTCCVMPNPDPDYGGFPISITIPAGTMIAECTVYSLFAQEETGGYMALNGTTN